jgi:hypothetical protein
LTAFYNRVEFLNVLNKARKCFTGPNNAYDFGNIYLCTIANNLRMCSDERYGEQDCHWTSIPLPSFKFGCQKHYDSIYRDIARNLQENMGVCDKWVPLAFNPLDLKRLTGCGQIDASEDTKGDKPDKDKSGK